MNSATQIALFVVPLLVLASTVFMDGSLNLVFSPLQIGAVMFTAIIANSLSPDGVCHWFEGIQLVGVYVLIAAAFYFL